MPKNSYFHNSRHILCLEKSTEVHSLHLKVKNIYIRFTAGNLRAYDLKLFAPAVPLDPLTITKPLINLLFVSIFAENEQVSFPIYLNVGIKMLQSIPHRVFCLLWLSAHAQSNHYAG